MSHHQTFNFWQDSFCLHILLLVLHSFFSLYFFFSLASPLHLFFFLSSTSLLLLVLHSFPLPLVTHTSHFFILLSLFSLLFPYSFPFSSSLSSSLFFSFRLIPPFLFSPFSRLTTFVFYPRFSPLRLPLQPNFSAVPPVTLFLSILLSFYSIPLPSRSPLHAPPRPTPVFLFP